MQTSPDWTLSKHNPREVVAVLDLPDEQYPNRFAAGALGALQYPGIQAITPPDASQTPRQGTQRFDGFKGIVKNSVTHSSVSLCANRRN
jgi:hypothetical protein